MTRNTFVIAFRQRVAHVFNPRQRIEVTNNGPTTKRLADKSRRLTGDRWFRHTIISGPIDRKNYDNTQCIGNRGRATTDGCLIGLTGVVWRLLDKFLLGSTGRKTLFAIFGGISWVDDAVFTIAANSVDLNVPIQMTKDV
jgi:hypothetical protein